MACAERVAAATEGGGSCLRCTGKNGKLEKGKGNPGLTQAHRHTQPQEQTDRRSREGEEKGWSWTRLPLLAQLTAAAPGARVRSKKSTSPSGISPARGMAQPLARGVSVIRG